MTPVPYKLEFFHLNNNSQTIAAHIPKCREKRHFGTRASLKPLGHDFKASDFHFTCPLTTKKIFWEREKNITIFSALKSSPLKSC